MKKVGIINVATSCLNYADIELDVKTLYNPITINGKSYLDYIEIKADEFYKIINQDKDLIAHTAMPSFQDLDKAIKEYIAEGVKEILVITISSGLSATYDHFKSFIKTKKYSARVEVLDSKAASIHEGYLDIVACKMSENGKNIDEILTELNRLISNSRIYFTVGDLRLLEANGRIGKASYLLANMSKIKPILYLDSDGVIDNFKKVRTIKRANKAMVDRVFEDVKGKEILCFTMILSDNPEMEDYVHNLVLAEYPDVKLYKTFNTPGIACHTGGNLVGLGYYLNN